MTSAVLGVDFPLCERGSLFLSAFLLLGWMDLASSNKCVSDFDVSDALRWDLEEILVEHSDVGEIPGLELAFSVLFELGVSSAGGVCH